MKINQGLKDYQEQQRRETLKLVSEAIQYLRDHQLKVTKRAIAEETGLGYNTLKAPYVQAHLLQYPEFNPNLPTMEPEEHLMKCEAEIKVLKAQLAKERQRNRILNASKSKLQLNYRDLQTRYEFVLDAYQRDFGKKFVSI